MGKNLKRFSWSFSLFCTALIFFWVCEKTLRTNSPDSAVTSYSYRSKADKDVSSEVMYNFATFAGTEWQTKVSTAFANLKRYNGNKENYLLVPLRFDSAHPKYTPTRGKVLSIIPTGATVRIERLLGPIDIQDCTLKVELVTAEDGQAI